MMSSFLGNLGVGELMIFSIVITVAVAAVVSLFNEKKTDRNKPFNIRFES